MTDSTEVKLHFLDYWRVIRSRMGIILLAFLLTMVTAGVTVYFVPRQYYSKVSMEVKPDENRIGIFEGSQGSRSTAADPRFVATQFNVIQQKEILYPVIQNLNLAKKWAVAGVKLPEEQAFIRLRKMLDIREIRNTEMIEIGVYSTDPKEAAEIANTIAVVYQDRRRNDQLQMVSRGLSQLEEEVNKQRKKVEEASEAAAKLRVELGIIDQDPETMGNAGDIETQTVRANETQVDEARLKTAELQTQMEQIEKMKPEEIMAGLNLLQIPDLTVQKLLPLYQDTLVDEQRLSNAGLGPNHPKLRALRATKEVYEQQLTDQINAIRKTLATRLQIAETTQAELEKRATAARKLFTERKNQTNDYIVAKNQYVQAKKILEAAEQRLSTERMQLNITTNPAKIWEKAEPALAPAKPNVPAYIALAAFVGIVVGVGLAFFLEYLDTSVKTLEDVEKFLEVPVLAVIPKNVGLLMKHAHGSDSPDAEAYRILRTNIEFNRRNPNANTITLISGGPGEGKSTTLNNLAFTCAKGGYNVLVVDADMRRPSQHHLFGVDNKTGLTDYLTRNIPFEELVRATSVENLSFMPSGVLPQDSVGILNSQRMIDLIAKTKRAYDLVFFDSPPILGVSDGSVLASEVDLTLMVIEHRRFPRSMLQRVKQAVLNVGGTLLGAVLNKVDAKHDASYGYYTSYYNYNEPTNGAEKPPKPVAGPKPVKAAAKVVTPTPRPIHTGGEQY